MEPSLWKLRASPADPLKISPQNANKGNLKRVLLYWDLWLTFTDLFYRNPRGTAKNIHGFILYWSFWIRKNDKTS